MVAVDRVVIRAMAALVALQASSSLAAPPVRLRNDIVEQLRKPRAAGKKIVIREIDLGGEGTDPWTRLRAGGTGPALAEFGALWATDPTITAGSTGIKAAHIVDLRFGVQ